MLRSRADNPLGLCPADPLEASDGRPTGQPSRAAAAPGKGQGEWNMTRTCGHTCRLDHSARLGAASTGWGSAQPDTEAVLPAISVPIINLYPGPLVLVSLGCCSKTTDQVAETADICFSQFWRPAAPRSGWQHGGVPEKTVFLACLLAAFLRVLRWPGGRKLWWPFL